MPKGTSIPSSAPLPDWIRLPRPLTENILRRLGPVEILQSAQKVCTTWWTVCREPSLWRVIVLKKSDRPLARYDDDFFCLLGVHRSKGQLIDMTIKDLLSVDLLEFISDQSCDLKRLCLEFGLRTTISPRGFTSSVKNFPRLEELHLTFLLSVYDDYHIESIGTFCPLLKSFSFNNTTFIFSWKFGVNNRDALSIAKSMPNLCSLSIVGNPLNNEGLEAILHGCPNLESLDIRDCVNVDVQCDLVRRYSERIKEFRCNRKDNHDGAFYRELYKEIYNVAEEDDRRIEDDDFHNGNAFLDRSDEEDEFCKGDNAWMSKLFCRFLFG